MTKYFYLNLIPTVFIPILLSSCNSKPENFEIDLSNFKVPSKSTVKIISPPDDSEPLTTKKETIDNKLINYKKKSEVLNSILLGKKDPFSEEGINVNNLTSDFKLTGFLNTEINKYVFVNYLGSFGTITKDSIGGVNTNLLPNGANVVNIDPKNLKLIINFEDEDYIFEL